MITVTVPRDVLLTANQRLHWTKKAERTRTLRWLAGRAWRRAGEPKLERAHVVVEVAYPDRRRRDVHNVMPTVKALVDGLVACGWLPDDDDKHLTGPDLRVSDERSAAGTYEFTIRWEES